MKVGGPGLCWMVRGLRGGRGDIKGKWEMGGKKEECSGGKNS